MNVYEEAHNLAKAIRESEEFKQFDTMQKLIDSDPKVSAQVKDLTERQLKLQARQMSGENVQSDLMQLSQEMSAIMMQIPAVAQYMQNTMRFSLMMNDVYKIITDAIGVGNMPNL